MSVAIYRDGIPQNLEAASTDALEWLLLLQRKWSRLEGSSEWKEENQGRLLDTITCLRQNLGDSKMCFVYSNKI